MTTGAYAVLPRNRPRGLDTVDLRCADPLTGRPVSSNAVPLPRVVAALVAGAVLPLAAATAVHAAAVTGPGPRASWASPSTATATDPGTPSVAPPTATMATLCQAAQIYTPEQRKAMASLLVNWGILKLPGYPKVRLRTVLKWGWTAKTGTTSLLAWRAKAVNLAWAEGLRERWLERRDWKARALYLDIWRSVNEGAPAPTVVTAADGTQVWAVHGVPGDAGTPWRLYQQQVYNDMAIGVRLSLTPCVRSVAWGPALDEWTRSWLDVTAQRFAYTHDEGWRYTPTSTAVTPSNHALFYDTGRIAAAVTVSDPAPCTPSNDRLTALADHAWTVDGVNTEGSTVYHRKNLEWWRAALTTVITARCEHKRLGQAIYRAAIIDTSLRAPTGPLAPLGDAELGPPDPSPIPAFAKAAQDRTPLALRTSMYLTSRGSWTDPDASFAALRYGVAVADEAHGHDNVAAVWWAVNSTPVIPTPGVFAYGDAAQRAAATGPGQQTLVQMPGAYVRRSADLVGYAATPGRTVWDLDVPTWVRPASDADPDPVPWAWRRTVEHDAAGRCLTIADVVDAGVTGLIDPGLSGRSVLADQYPAVQVTNLAAELLWTANPDQTVFTGTRPDGTVVASVTTSGPSTLSWDGYRRPLLVAEPRTQNPRLNQPVTPGQPVRLTACGAAPVNG